MKAILVIKLDDEWLDRMNTTYDEMFADVTIYKKEDLKNQCDYSQRLYRCWCPLKPMPQKRVLEDFVQNDYFMGSKVDLEKMIRYVRARANNEIIDEILGEKDDR